jgi:RNA polymerase sigma-70 factor, ECF subfamily
MVSRRFTRTIPILPSLQKRGFQKFPRPENLSSPLESLTSFPTDSDPSGSIAASAVKLIGRNCLQFLTVSPATPSCGDIIACVSSLEKSNEDVIRDLKSGREPEENFRLLFLRYHGQVYRFFVRKGIPPEDARDLTQDVFFSVYKGMASLQGEAQFAAWLFTIARNAFVSHIQKRHAKKREGLHVVGKEREAEGLASELESVPATGKGSNVLQDFLDREKVTRMKAALTELPDQMRRCVQLRVASEKSYDEIAVLMGLSINTVKAHLFKARQVLRDKLGREFGEVEI